MSHDMVGGEGHAVYTMPALPSDVLRTIQFDHFFAAYRGASFAVKTRDGWRWLSSPFRPPALTACFSSRAVLDEVISESTEDGLAKVFLDGNLEIQGDTVGLLHVAEYVLQHSGTLSRAMIHTVANTVARWFRRLKGGVQDPFLAGWRFQAGTDLPPEFFAPWLGETLPHVSAYFQEPEEGFETAQLSALDRICGAVELSEDDRLLDASCGWGTLLAYAIGRFDVNAQGIAFSEAQATIAEERLRQRRLQSRCYIHTKELASVASVPDQFDKIVDSDTFHQIAYSHLPEFLDSTHRLLTPRGLLLCHRITRSGTARQPLGKLGSEGLASGRFATLSQELAVAEGAGFRVQSVEDWSRSYRLTLRRWIERLQHNVLYSSGARSRDARSWLFCLLDTAAKVDAGELQLSQVVLARTA